MVREYKDSGIEWIGRIPREWRVCRLKELGFLYGGLTGKSGTDFDVEEDDKFAYFIPFTNIFNNMVIDTNKLYKVKVEDGEMQNEVHQGDLLFLMSSEDYEGIGKPALLDASISHLYLNSFCKGLRIVSDNVVPKFLLYMMTSHIMREQIRLEAKGFIRINLRQEKLMNVSLYLPPISEQRAIASYLDKKCAEIDSLVELQEQMIAQLTDYKQSVITEAVTKGLNPEAELVPSGIDWIGDVPKTWNTQRLKFLCTIQTGNQDTQDSDPVGIYPFYVRSPIVERSNKYSFEGEGILMAGDGAGAGRVFHHVYGKYAVHQRVYRLANIKGINSDFLFYFLSSLFCKEMDRGSAQSTVPSVRLPMLQNFSVCIPSVEEQNDIVSLLDAKCHEIDTLISIKRQKIETLKDYKKSIIFEAVTGKTNID